MYLKTTFANGLRLVSHPMKDRESASIGVWVGVGGRYENDEIKGAAHFLEHMAFKGSRHYSCKQIKEKIEGVGGSVNAFTSEEQTCYYARIPSGHLPQTFDILTDIVCYPSLAQEDVVKESTVILEEIKMYHDLPQYHVMELLDELLWPDHPLGKNLAGSMQSVSAMTDIKLRHFHDLHYRPENLVISACGKIQHDRLAKMIDKKLRDMKSSQRDNFVGFSGIQKHPRMKILNKPTEQMHLALGVLGLPDDHEDKYALNLLNVILGGNMSSRLFDEIREKRGLVYSIGSGVKYLKDTGLFLVRAGVDKTKLVEALDVILKELRKIAQKGVSEDEFARARDFYLGQVLLGLEDTMEHMLWIGESVLSRGRVKTQAQVVRLVNAVQRDDIARMAKNILNPKAFNFAVVGPVTDKQTQELSKLLL